MERTRKTLVRCEPLKTPVAFRLYTNSKSSIYIYFRMVSSQRRRDRFDASPALQTIFSEKE
jgi:hypothetical protein